MNTELLAVKENTDYSLFHYRVTFYDFYTRFA